MGDEQLDMSPRRSYSDGCQLCCRNDEIERNEIEVERFLHQSEKSAVRHTSEGDSAKKLALLRSNVAKNLLRVSAGNNPKMDDKSYPKRMTMFSTMLYVWLETV